MFGQAKQLVTQASNRHVDNVIFNILVRLQSKELLNQSCMLNTLNEQYSRVSKAAACIRSYQGTTVSLSLIKSAMTSWQMHLQRIGPYLITGKGIWWSINSNSYNFMMLTTTKMLMRKDHNSFIIWTSFGRETNKYGSKF